MPDLLDLRIGPPAHGGHCVARHEGRVVFVRHTAPGELVRVRLTDSTSRFQRGEAVQILEPSPDRVPSRWPEAGPGGVGGGELAHLKLAAQRVWKQTVLLDTLRRIGHLDPEHPALQGLQVQSLPGDDQADGLGYRSRIRLIADGQGRAGMYAHRSHEVVPLAQIPLASQRIIDTGLLSRRWPPGAQIDAIAPSAGQVLVLVDGEPVADERRKVRERVRLGTDQVFTYRLSATGFWQVHTRAPQTLVHQVLQAADLAAGSQVLELYAGAGLLTVPLAQATGPGGAVHAVEADEQGAKDARRNAHGLPQIHLHTGVASQVLAQKQIDASVVVLDPPRSGAGKRTLHPLLSGNQAGRERPERVVYVACDPAALARDLAIARRAGYELVSLRAFDLFPHTHHMECLAVLRPR